jgi:Mg/Co/Ni transporter MgtE
VSDSFFKTHTEVAAHLAVARVPMFRGSLSAAEARALLQTTNFDVVDAILVLDDQGHFAGAARLKDVLRAPDEAALSSLAVKEWPAVGPDIDQEHAVALAHQHAITAIPVVAADGPPAWAHSRACAA